MLLQSVFEDYAFEFEEEFKGTLFFKKHYGEQPLFLSYDKNEQMLRVRWDRSLGFYSVVIGGIKIYEGSELDFVLSRQIGLNLSC